MVTLGIKACACSSRPARPAPDHRVTSLVIGLNYFNFIIFHVYGRFVCMDVYAPCLCLIPSVIDGCELSRRSPGRLFALHAGLKLVTLLLKFELYVSIPKRIPL